jgi:hypothetical protein
MTRRVAGHRRGYVLILTLGLLALAATLLVGVARASLRHAVAAREAVDGLQRRVGVRSCQSVALPHAGDILIRQEQQRKAPVAVLRTSVALGGQRFDVIVADEQAKANVNALIERSPDGAASRLRELLEPTGVASAIRLRQPPVSSFGGMFDRVSIENLANGRGGRPAALDFVTCWGTGAINARRAPESVLRVASNPPLGPNEVAQLLQLRQDRFRGVRGPSAPVPGADSSADRVGKLFSQSSGPGSGSAGGLTTGSSCFSLWVIVRDGRRSWEHFAVRDESDPQRAQTRTFVW